MRNERRAAEHEGLRVVVVVVTGTGRAFCGGGNMKQRAREDQSGALQTQEARARARRNRLRFEVHRVPQALQYLDTQTFPETLESAQAAMTVVHTSDDTREGPRPFAEKRQAVFRGR